MGGNAFYFGAQGNFTMGNGSNSLSIGANVSFFEGKSIMMVDLVLILFRSAITSQQIQLVQLK